MAVHANRIRNGDKIEVYFERGVVKEIDALNLRDKTSSGVGFNSRLTAMIATFPRKTVRCVTSQQRTHVGERLCSAQRTTAAGPVVTRFGDADKRDGIVHEVDLVRCGKLLSVVDCDPDWLTMSIPGATPALP